MRSTPRGTQVAVYTLCNAQVAFTMRKFPAQCASCLRSTSVKLCGVCGALSVHLGMCGQLYHVHITGLGVFVSSDDEGGAMDGMDTSDTGSEGGGW